MSAPSDSGLTVTANDGQQYFIYGKTRIKVVEHFPQNGKPYDEIIVTLIRKKIKQNSQKTA